MRQNGPTCSNISLPVSIKAKNLALPATLNASTLDSFINGVGSSGFDLATNFIDVKGTYSIAARFCAPEVYNASRANTLQLLVHGITQTLEYWDALGSSDTATFNSSEYSWVDYASTQGYPTLSIDRLGAGLSSKPDGLLIVQIPAQVETVHSLVGSIRNGSINNQVFHKIVYVGHSFGSELGNAHAANYPDDIDAYILTGYTPFIKSGMASTLALAAPSPASIAVPDRFADLPPDYLAASNHNGTDHLFFYVPAIDSGLLELSWSSRGTVTMGELASTLFSPSVVSQYYGNVFVVTGQQDTIFCAEGLQGIDSIRSEVGNCGIGLSSKVAQVKTQYPDVKSFDYFEPNNTGHGTVLQYGAQAQFKNSHDWLAKFGY